MAAAKLIERYNPHKDPARQAALQRLLDSVADNQVKSPTPPLPLPCCFTTTYLSSVLLYLSVSPQAYLSFNVAPVQRALDILTTHFDPRRPVEHFSLELRPTPRKWGFGHGSFGMGFSSKVIMLYHHPPVTHGPCPSAVVICIFTDARPVVGFVFCTMFVCVLQYMGGGACLR